MTYRSTRTRRFAALFSTAFLTIMAHIDVWGLDLSGFFEKLPHESRPFLMQEGYVSTFKFEAGGNLNKVYRYSFYLSFHLTGETEAAKRSQRILLGSADPKDASTYKDGDGVTQFNRTGISLPVRLTIQRLSDSTTVYTRTFDNLWTLSRGSDTCDKLIDQVWLDPAEYLINLESLQTIRSVADVGVTFEIGLPGKH